MRTVILNSMMLLHSISCKQITPENLKNMDNIKAILDNEVSKGRTPSVQYLFFNTDTVLYEYANGYSDLKKGTKVDTNTTFNVLSITKTFTAMAIMQLVEKKLVSLERPVNQYLPISIISEKVLVRHLLTHTSGLANPLPISWIHLSSDHYNFKRDDFFNPILEENKNLKTEPGQKFKYSNLGYLYLARIIESVTGITYEEYVSNNILDKLQLKSELDFKIQHENLHAKGYHSNRSISMLLLNFMLDKSKYMDESVGKWKPFNQYYVNGAPYGGLISNSHGLVKYGQEMLKDDNILISDEYKKLLFTENVDGQGKNTGMCLSWYTGKLDKYRYFTHAGGGGGYYCELRLYPELKSGSFIVFNSSGFSDKRFLDKLAIHLVENDAN
jgi:CubicO group peptidase (beta-lactamase class C family)